VILYLDTSSLVKLYAPEPESAAVKQLVEAAEFTVTSRVAYVELRAVLARKRREQAMNLKDYRLVVQDLDHDWESYFIVDVSDVLIKSAGQLAEKHALRGHDAIHLASAVIVRRQGNQPVNFSCFDARLSRAARREGLDIAS
jgi:predicted nucleic acid-binding protein